jgi:hypothetical protein
MNGLPPFLQQVIQAADGVVDDTVADFLPQVERLVGFEIRVAGQIDLQQVAATDMRVDLLETLHKLAGFGITGILNFIVRDVITMQQPDDQHPTRESATDLAMRTDPACQTRGDAGDTVHFDLHCLANCQEHRLGSVVTVIEIVYGFIRDLLGGGISIHDEGSYYYIAMLSYYDECRSVANCLLLRGELRSSY